MVELATCFMGHGTASSPQVDPPQVSPLSLPLERTHSSAGEVAFVAPLKDYFASRGADQRSRRLKLVDRFSVSKDPKVLARQVLTEIREQPSQDRMAAAIDLLRLTSWPVRSLAVDMVTHPVESGQRDDEYFVAGMAAAKADPEVIPALLRAKNTAMREAGIEALGDRPEAEARPLLDSVVQGEESPYLRNRATEVLAELT